MSVSTTFDLLLRGGRVIDPASGHRRHQRCRHSCSDRSPPFSPIFCRQARTEVLMSRTKSCCSGLIDTHAHVYQYVTGRFGVNARHGGRPVRGNDAGRSGRAVLHDIAPGFRHFIAEKRAVAHLRLSVRPIWLEVWKDTIIPIFTAPTASISMPRVKAARPRIAISFAASRRHAEIGGFARWGIRVIEMAAEIGRRADLSGLCAFRTIVGLPESGTNGEDVDTDPGARDPAASFRRCPAHPFTRHPGGFVNREGEVHPVIQAALDRGLRVDVGHGSHFSYPPRAQGHCRRYHSDHVGSRYPRLQYACAGTGRTRRTSMSMTRTIRSQVRQKFSLVQAMSSMMALGPHAGASGADGDSRIRPKCWVFRIPSARCVPAWRPTSPCLPRSPAAIFCATTRRWK